MAIEKHGEDESFASLGANPTGAFAGFQQLFSDRLDELIKAATASRSAQLENEEDSAVLGLAEMIGFLDSFKRGEFPKAATLQVPSFNDLQAIDAETLSLINQRVEQFLAQNHLDDFPYALVLDSAYLDTAAQNPDLVKILEYFGITPEDITEIRALCEVRDSVFKAAYPEEKSYKEAFPPLPADLNDKLRKIMEQ